MKLTQSVVIVTLILAFAKLSFGQNGIQRRYSGGWAGTIWRYEFAKDGTFKWNAHGHFGKMSRTGTYKIYNDTLEILSGFENTAKTLNRLYLMKGDTCIIDCELKEVYCQ